MAHEVPVMRRLPNGDRIFPDSAKIREVNLPDYLHTGQIVTPGDLEGVAGLTPETVQQLIDQARADVLAQVNGMLQNLPKPQTAYVFSQPVPTSTVTVTHNLGRRAVAVVAYSIDMTVQYEFFQVTPLNENMAQLSFDDPIEFIAVFT